MKKAKTVFVCQECGYESPKWMGQCVCGAWNSFVEEKVPEAVKDPRSRSFSGAEGRAPARPVSVSDVVSQDSGRIDTGIGELDRVLGGGLVKGSLVLISGEPGIGKSTIIIQAAAHIARTVGPVLYVSGEESEEQIKLRADRVCRGADGSLPLPEDLFLLAETNMENIMEVSARLQPALLIIDSIQTMYTGELESAAGSVSQVRGCGNLLMNMGKTGGLPIFIVAHVTKSGELAGPKIVEHMVDAVLQFNGERSSDLRILRALKNRFGTTSEIGAFEMREEGLAEIENVSACFLEGRESGAEGAVCTAVCEGTRPLLLEIQALTAPTNVGFARRSSVGIDSQRLNMIIAVLERKAGLALFNRDVYVNVVGGFRPEGTSSDLAVAMAIWSQEKKVSVPQDVLAIGEIGLTGELRPVQNAERLIKEAKRMGFASVVLPSRSADKLRGRVEGIRLAGVKNISEALQYIVDI